MIKSANNQEDIFNKLSSLLMIDCYHQITSDKALDILRQTKAQRLDSKSNDNIHLIDLEKWMKIIQSNDEARINEEVTTLSVSTEELRKIVNIPYNTIT